MRKVTIAQCSEHSIDYGKVHANAQNEVLAKSGDTSLLETEINCIN